MSIGRGCFAIVTTLAEKQAAATAQAHTTFCARLHLLCRHRALWPTADAFPPHSSRRCPRSPIRPPAQSLRRMALPLRVQCGNRRSQTHVPLEYWPGSEPWTWLDSRAPKASRGSRQRGCVCNCARERTRTVYPKRSTGDHGQRQRPLLEDQEPHFSRHLLI